MSSIRSAVRARVLPPGGARAGLLNFEHVIVVLGAEDRRGLLSRLRTGLAQARKHPSAAVIVTGGGVASPASEGKVMERWLVARGIDPGRIIVEPSAMYTLQNVELTAPAIEAMGATRVTLVTERFHLARGRGLLVEALRQRKLSHVTVNSVAADDREVEPAAMRDLVAHERFALGRDLRTMRGGQP